MFVSPTKKVGPLGFPSRSWPGSAAPSQRRRVGYWLPVRGCGHKSDMTAPPPALNTTSEPINGFTVRLRTDPHSASAGVLTRHSRGSSLGPPPDSPMGGPGASRPSGPPSHWVSGNCEQLMLRAGPKTWGPSLGVPGDRCQQSPQIHKIRPSLGLCGLVVQSSLSTAWLQK